MSSASLSASVRTGVGKGIARSLRRDGRVPAVIYGHARAPQSLSVDARELGRLLGQVSAETTVIELAIDGATSRTLIRDIQRHPVKRAILHVDFQELVAGEKISVNVPIVLVGTAVGVRLHGGILSHIMQELEVLVDPANIPNKIEVDISELGLGASVHVDELTIPEGVEVLADMRDTILTVSASKASEEIAAPAEPAAGEPEVIRKTKAEEEAEAKKK